MPSVLLSDRPTLDMDDQHTPRRISTATRVGSELDSIVLAILIIGRVEEEMKKRKVEGRRIVEDRAGSEKRRRDDGDRCRLEGKWSRIKRGFCWADEPGADVTEDASV